MSMIDRTSESRASAPSSPFLESARAAFAATVRFFNNRFAIKQMVELDDALLKDIGLTRRDVERAHFAPVSGDPMTDLKRSASRQAQRMII